MSPAGAEQFGFGPAEALCRAFAQGSLLVATYDPDDVLQYASAAFRKAFRLDGSEGVLTFADLILRSAQAGFGPRIDSGDVATFIAKTQLRRRSRPGQRFFTTDMIDGSWYWMTETLLDDGWLVLVGSEISPLKETERLLAAAHEMAVYEATTDALTGLPNRRKILACLRSALAAPLSEQMPMVIALLDLDMFKNINDEHGHLAGDAVLCDFANLARNLVRRSDVIGRIGGEEFLIVMPHTTVHDALLVIERLREGALGREVITADGTQLRYSVSAGITQVSTRENIDDAFERADRALYKSKRLGRNRVSLEI